MRILYIAPGNNPHTWKWVGWFGRRYPGEVALLPYQDPVPNGILQNIEIITPHIPPYKIASITLPQKSRVRRIVKDYAPDLLHALWGYGSGNYAAWTGFHPFLLSPWGSEITIFPYREGVKGKIQRELVIGALKSADAITATSEFLRDAIIELAPDIKQPVLFPYGVDTSIFDPEKIGEPLRFESEEHIQVGGEIFTVGFFKSLVKTYGPDILLRAIAISRREIPGLRCVMAGEGEMRSRLEQMARELEISDCVIFPGLIPHIDMPRALAGVDIVAMPSRYETFGVTALEASAMRKPVILTSKWGMVEVARDGETGFYIEPEGSESLAKYIVKLAQNRKLRDEMGKAGRDFVRSKFEFNEIMERADEFCQALIK